MTERPEWRYVIKVLDEVMGQGRRKDVVKDRDPDEIDGVSTDSQQPPAGPCRAEQSRPGHPLGEEHSDHVS